MIVTQSNFNDAIADDPMDVSIRAMYADWLEERGMTEASQFQRDTILYLIDKLFRVHKKGKFKETSDELSEKVLRIRHELYNLLVTPDSGFMVPGLLKLANARSETRILYMEAIVGCVLCAARRGTWAQCHTSDLLRPRNPHVVCVAARRTDMKIRVGVMATNYNSPTMAVCNLHKNAKPAKFREWADDEPQLMVSRVLKSDDLEKALGLPS